MKKIGFIILIFSFFLLPAGPVSAAVEYSVNPLLSSVTYSYHFDHPVFDFELSGIDFLYALTVENTGATANIGVDKLCLYQDDGNNVFDGMAIDTDLGCGNWSVDGQYWYWDDLAVFLGDNPRLFITVETTTLSRSIPLQLRIPTYYDQADDGLFDAGVDRGLFVLGETGLPLSDLMDTSTHYLDSRSGSNADLFGPKIVVTNLDDGDTLLDGAYYTIEGQARDQGGSLINSLEVCIDEICQIGFDLQDNYLHWEYDWVFDGDGAHEIYVKSFDNAGNLSTTDPITVTVDNSAIYSRENSSYVVSKSVAGLNEVVSINFDIRDVNNDPKSDIFVEVNPFSTVGVRIDKESGYSDENGSIVFETWSNVAGEVSYDIYVDEVYFSSFYINYEVAAVDFPVLDFETGRFIKLADQPAVYFLGADNVRHAYPTQKIWESYWGSYFSQVEVVTNDAMAGYNLGRNVTFKTGTLMKIPSVPKVYQVQNTGEIRWVPDELTANLLFGEGWASLVKDLPESFFTDYAESTVLTSG